MTLGKYILPEKVMEYLEKHNGLFLVKPLCYFFESRLCAKLLSSDRPQILRDASNEWLNAHNIFLDSQCSYQ